MRWGAPAVTGALVLLALEAIALGANQIVDISPMAGHPVLCDSHEIFVDWGGGSCFTCDVN